MIVSFSSPSPANRHPFFLINAQRKEGDGKKRLIHFTTHCPLTYSPLAPNQPKKTENPPSQFILSPHIHP